MLAMSNVKVIEKQVGLFCLCSRSLLTFFLTQGVARNEDLLNVVQLAKRAMPNRPDGVVVGVHIRNTCGTH